MSDQNKESSLLGDEATRRRIYELRQERDRVDQLIADGQLPKSTKAVTELIREKEEELQKNLEKQRELNPEEDELLQNTQAASEQAEGDLLNVEQAGTQQQTEPAEQDQDEEPPSVQAEEVNIEEGDSTTVAGADSSDLDFFLNSTEPNLASSGEGQEPPPQDQPTSPSPSPDAASPSDGLAPPKPVKQDKLPDVSSQTEQESKPEDTGDDLLGGDGSSIEEQQDDFQLSTNTQPAENIEGSDELGLKTLGEQFDEEPEAPSIEEPSPADPLDPGQPVLNVQEPEAPQAGGPSITGNPVQEIMPDNAKAANTEDPKSLNQQPRLNKTQQKKADRREALLTGQETRRQEQLKRFPWLAQAEEVDEEELGDAEKYKAQMRRKHAQTDGRHHFGGTAPSSIPGGNQTGMQAAGMQYANEFDSFAAETGDLLEGLASAISILSRKVRNAQKILNEAMT